MADKSRYTGHLIDFNVRAERMGWLPSAPQLGTNPLTIAGEAEKAGMNPVDYTVKSLKEGSIRFAAEQPENGKNHPRNLFIWRSNLLGSSGKDVYKRQHQLLLIMAKMTPLRQGRQQNTVLRMRVSQPPLQGRAAITNG